MPTQLALAFDVVPVTCAVQQRYHSIAPCLARISTPAEQAQALNVGYSTVTRWLREFRDKGMPGLFSETQYPRDPYTPGHHCATAKPSSFSKTWIRINWLNLSSSLRFRRHYRKISPTVEPA